MFHFIRAPNARTSYQLSNKTELRVSLSLTLFTLCVCVCVCMCVCFFLYLFDLSAVENYIAGGSWTGVEVVLEGVKVERPQTDG